MTFSYHTLAGAWKAALLLLALTLPGASMAQGGPTGTPGGGSAGACVSAGAGSSYEDIISNAVNFAPAGDLSIQMLGAFFGQDYYTLSLSASGGGLPSAADFDGSAAIGATEGDASPRTGAPDAFSLTSSSLFGILSAIMNAACLALAGWLIMVTVMTGSLNSAHEGVVLGQQYSTLWVPVRIVIALGALMPIFGGYSLAQQILMIVGRIGVGFANVAYQAGLAFVVGAGGTVISNPDKNTDDIVAAMVEAETCALFAEDSGMTVERVTHSQEGASFVRSLTNRLGITRDAPIAARYYYRYDVTSPGTDMKRGACGEIEVKVPGVLYDDVEPGYYNAVQAAYDGFWNTLMTARSGAGQMAAQIVNMQGNPQLNYQPWFDAQTTAFNGSRQLNTDLRLAALSQAGGQGDARVCGVINEMRDIGWVMLGSIYWNVSNFSMENRRRTAEVNDNIRASSPATSIRAATMRPPVSGAPFSRSGVVEDYNMVLARYGTGAQHIGQANAAASVTGDMQGNIGERASSNLEMAVQITADGTVDDGYIKQIFQMFGLRGATDKVVEMITADGDVIGNLSSVGHYMLGITATAYTLTIANRAIDVGTRDNVVTWATRKASGLHPGTAAVSALNAIISDLAPILMAILLPLLILALYFAFYLPSIPIIYWFGSVTSWLIANVQAVISAPIWAAAHVVPTGNGFSNDQARNGYMTLLAIMMRPLLMVIGFFAGMAVLQIMGLFIGAIFPIAMRSIVMDSVFGLFSFVTMLAIFLVIFISVANRVFSLAFELADDILEYFGGGRRQLGDSEIGRSASSTFMGAFVSQGQGALRGAAVAPRAGAVPAGSAGTSGAKPSAGSGFQGQSNTGANAGI